MTPANCVRCEKYHRETFMQGEVIVDLDGYTSLAKLPAPICRTCIEEFKRWWCSATATPAAEAEDPDYPLSRGD